MKYKDGVILAITKVAEGRRINIVPCPEIERAMLIADGLSISLTKKEAVVTSVLDGVHGENSLHYTGKAFDLRVRHYETMDDVKKLHQAIKDALGKGYDVVFETDHIHVEYDPKN